MIMTAHVVLTLFAILPVTACGYLLVLTVLSGRPRNPQPSARTIHFDVIVPAHNEAAGIERTINSLRRLDWPSSAFRLIVVADNCSDNTGELARAGGATVLTRDHERLRGKGHALEFAFAHSRRDGWARAIVVVDADSEASANLLEAMASRIEQGVHAIQAHYGVLNPLVSWRTRLMTIAMAALHVVRSRARERLSVSCGVRGNGWCVTHELLERVPYHAYSLTEDIEFGITLGLAGYRVAYADEAHVYGEMVSREASARKQRERWERGRFLLMRSKTWPLLHAAAAQKSAVCLDLAFDLLVPPLSYVALSILTLSALAAVVHWWHPYLLSWAWVAVGCAGALSAHVLRGWQLSGIGWRGCIDLLHVPFFLLWKVRLAFNRSASEEWVRTERERL